VQRAVSAAAAVVVAISPIAIVCCSGGAGGDAGGDARAAEASGGDALAAEASGDARVDDSSVSGDGAPTYAPTFSAIYDEILAQSCALAFCHAGADFLTITGKDQAYGALVNAPAKGPQCASSGLKLVDPGHPETSLLYLKVTSPPCGSKMPLLYGDASGSLDPMQIDQIRTWIEAGAPNI
jgi:hypothetical protein